MKGIFLIALLLISCGPQYVNDPNASVIVTSKYEGEPERIILLPGDKHKPQIACNSNDDLGCSIALYIASEHHMKKAMKLGENGMYLSANCEYMLALTRLAEAEIRIQRAKRKDITTFKRIKEMNLEIKVKERMEFCERKNNIVRKFLWRP